MFAVIVSTRETHEIEAFGPYRYIETGDEVQRSIEADGKYDPEDYEFALVRLKKWRS